MIVVPGPASKELGGKIAKELNAKVIGVFFKQFPDGESYVRFEGELENENVVIVQSTCPPQDSNLIRLFLLAGTAKDLGAKKVVVVVPYLAYARQDKRFLPGEAVSVNVMARVLKAIDIDGLVTVNVHEEKVLKKFDFPAKNVSAMGVLAKYFKEKGFDGAFALAPDDGALELAKEAAEVLGGGYDWLYKKRDLHTGEVETKAKKLDVAGRDVIIFDDIISTGGTIVNAAKILKEQGARRIFAACAHPLLIGNAIERILSSGVEEIVGTDSVPSMVSKVSVAPVIAKSLAEDF